MTTFKLDGLPESVRIGPHDVRFARLEGVDAQRNLGTFVPAEQAIRLQSEYPSGSMAVDTVLHEILHAIWSVATMEPKQGEEHIVSCTATYLTQIIRDNPGLMAWARKAMEP